MKTIATVLLYLFGLSGGAAYAVIAGGYGIGLSRIFLAMLPCWIVLGVAAVREARGTLTPEGRGWVVVGAVLAAVVLWIGHGRVEDHKQGGLVNAGLHCYAAQCKLGEQLADAKVSLEQRRAALSELLNTRSHHYRVENGILACGDHGTPKTLELRGRPYPPACPGPIRVPAEISASQ